MAEKVTSRLAGLASFLEGTCGRREMTNCPGDVSQTTGPQKKPVCSKDEREAGPEGGWGGCGGEGAAMKSRV